MEEITYTKAYQELQEIVENIENSEINIDELENKIKRASELLKICKDKLHKTETSVLKNLDEINNYNIE
ncbi:exodeoxyribonuclease VII small subunit [Psychroflexus aestuariivivens]|uniref:exodeoxyribonuclease VII small subunit n=1 Tax=Psychroflexus aestuariivivens TaxID=1795040 RepID=UPI000FDA6B7B|nr:exodeoxyribonuclease VII small subunit [Psychroflexus aestuariivivens]